MLKHTFAVQISSMKNRFQVSTLILLVLTVAACNNTQPLPILGNRYAETKEVNGKTITDTVYQTIPAFRFINQDGMPVSNKLVEGKIYVADFFFATCPTICPVMKKNMIEVFEAYRNNPDIFLLSHTIDPEHDTLEVLKDYCTRLGSDGKQWMFLTGSRDSIYQIAETGYYASAQVDSTEPGGFVHSGGFILVDRKQRVRGIYDGTSKTDTKRLINDMQLLLDEK